MISKRSTSKAKAANVGLVLCFMGLIAWPAMLVRGLIPGGLSAMSSANIFFLLGIAACLMARRRYPWLVSELVFLGAIGALLVMAAYSDYQGGIGFAYSIYSLAIVTLPLLLIWRAPHISLSADIVERGIKCFDYVLLACVVIAAVDQYLLSQTLTSALVLFAGASRDGNLDRAWTIYGHPLYTTGLLFVAFGLSKAFESHYGRKVIPEPVLLVMLVLGMMVCASKSGMLVMLALLILWYVRDVKQALPLLLALVLAYALGGFDLLIERLQSGSLTTGRFETMDEIASAGLQKPYGLFYGYGTDSPFVVYESDSDTYRFLKWASSAYEFPILGFSLNYGIMYTCILYAILFAYPIVRFIRHRQWSLLLAFLGPAVFYQTYNALYLTSTNAMMVMCFFTMLLLCFSYEEASIAQQTSSCVESNLIAEPSAKGRFRHA